MVVHCIALINQSTRLVDRIARPKQKCKWRHDSECCRGAAASFEDLAAGVRPKIMSTVS